MRYKAKWFNPNSGNYFLPMKSHPAVLVQYSTVLNDLEFLCLCTFKQLPRCTPEAAANQ